MPKEDKWLKWYEGQPVTIAFRVKHDQLVKLMQGKAILVNAKGDKFTLKKEMPKKRGRPKNKKSVKV